MIKFETAIFSGKQPGKFREIYSSYQEHRYENPRCQLRNEVDFHAEYLEVHTPLQLSIFLTTALFDVSIFSNLS